MSDTNALVERFLAWPVPKSVRSDLCVTQDYPHQRSGTNLLTADEARQMIEYLFGDTLRAQATALAEAEVERDRLRAIHGAKSTIEECFDRTSYTTLSAAIKGWKERATAAEAERDAARAEAGRLKPRKCAATTSTDPPQDCDAPFCGCNPAWQEALSMAQESGWLTDREACVLKAKLAREEKLT